MTKTKASSPSRKIASEPQTTTLPLAKIRADGGTQTRATLNTETIADYTAAIQAGATFPAVEVFNDGETYWLADGFHRFRAHEQAGKARIAAVVHQGTRRDAILHSVGANSAHGLRRTNADKHRAVETLLRDDEWAKWSDRRISAQCGVSNNFVSELRHALEQRHQRISKLGSLSSDDSEKRLYLTKHGIPSTMRTAKIGSKREAATGTVVNTETGEVLESPADPRRTSRRAVAAAITNFRNAVAGEGAAEGVPSFPTLASEPIDDEAVIALMVLSTERECKAVATAAETNDVVAIRAARMAERARQLADLLRRLLKHPSQSLGELELQGAVDSGPARCRMCERPLTDPESIILGIGPDCRQKRVPA